MKSLTLVLAVFAVLVLAACGDDSSGESPGSASATTDRTDSNTADTGGESSGARPDSGPPKKPKPKVVVPEGPPPKNEVIVRDIEVGNGEEIKDNDKIFVDYVTVRYKDGKEKESSWDGTASEATFVMDSLNLIEGWERGMEGMKVGGRRELIVPKKLAYNNSDGALIYVVDLLGIE